MTGNPGTLDEAFESFAVDAWRLEARDFYHIPSDARFDAFMRSGVHPEPNDEWNAVISSAHARKARISRIRLIGWPITEYTKWELLAYLNNAAAGEEVSIVDRNWLDHTWDAAPDVWIFDSAIAFVQKYTTDGGYIGAQRVDAAPYVGMRHRLEPHAIPLDRYQVTTIPTPRPSRSAVEHLPIEITR